MSLLEMLKADGLKPVRVGGKDGGEYASACPGCGGNDRFHCWPDRQGGKHPGHWWCRGCEKKGDAISYLREFRAMTYKDACDYLGVEAGRPSISSPAVRQPHAREAWTPKPLEIPGELWRQRAAELLARCNKQLWQTDETISWLKQARGLDEDTIFERRLGWCPVGFWQERSAWGLAPSGKGFTRMYVPMGLVIPMFAGQLVRLRIRQPEGEPRYKALSGSCHAPMLLSSQARAALIVESELDALLVSQAAGDLVNVLAMGSSSIRPDFAAHQLLRASRIILVALDSDKAGATESRRWWAANYRQAARCPMVGGKDPADAFAHGVNIRAWVEAALNGGAQPMRALA